MIRPSPYASAVLLTLMSTPAVSETTLFDIGAIRAGKTLCASITPEQGCFGYMKPTIKGDKLQTTVEMLFSPGPRVYVVYTEEEDLASWDSCDRKEDYKRIEGPVFYKNGEPLPDIERGMFEKAFEIEYRQSEKEGEENCIEPVTTPLGTAYTVKVNGKLSSDPPIYLQWYQPEDLPPLMLGAKSMLYPRKTR